MSNINNKNEQTNNIKEIGGFIADKVKPFLADVISSKALIDKALSNISNIKNAKLEKELKQEKVDVVEQTPKINKADGDIKAAVQQSEKVVANAAPKVEDKPTQKVEVSETPKKVEEGASAKPAESSQNVEQSNVEKPAQTPRVYINPEMRSNNAQQSGGYNNNREGNNNYSQGSGTGYQGNRPQGSGTGYQGNRPQGSGTGYQGSNYQGNRPQGSGTGYQGNRPQGTGTGYQGNNYQGNRPQGTGTGYQGNRPQGAGTGYQGNRPQGTGTGTGYQGNRPQGAGTGYQGNNYQGNRPQGTGTGYQGNRPQGAGTGYQGNRPQGTGTGYQGNRPQGTGYQGGYQGNRPGAKPGGFGQGMIPAVPISAKKDTSAIKKKPITTFASKDDNRKTLNKRDLIKRGYDVDVSLMNDGAPTRYLKNKKVKKENQFTPKFITIEHVILNSDIIPIKVFSEKIGKTSTEIVKKMFNMGKFVTVNDAISFEDAEFVALDYGISCELKPDQTAEDVLANFVADNKDTEGMLKRPPIVTIMGHVDHGKTSLLDYIRKANVVNSEAGGITQHIGAYTIDINNERITFLDTPGHEAFTAMRRRGAKVTDIAIIVVAADDGIMPQTVEAINHAKEAGVSIVVAVNKIDKTDGNLDKIKQQLSNHNVLAEDWGGDVMICPVSAKTGQGVKELLESILLVAEVLELKANKKCQATGSIIEARLDKGAGPIATILVQNGTLRVKDYVVAGNVIGKIRAMKDHTGKSVKEATPSMAVQIQGFSEVPNAGDIMVVVADEKLAKQVAQERLNKERSEMSMANSARSLDEMFKNANSGEIKTLAVVIKADVQGSAEALKQSLVKLSDEMAEENVKIHISHAGVGAINESDIMLAETSKAIVIAFNVKPDPKAKLLADKLGVEIRLYSIIYAAIEDIQLALNGMTTPKYKEVIIGHAEIRAVFKLSSQGVIAGSYITDGKFNRNCNVRITRDNAVVYDGKVASIRREKDDVKDIAAGYECGIGLDKFDEIKVGDVMEAFIMERIKKA